MMSPTIARFRDLFTATDRCTAGLASNQAGSVLVYVAALLPFLIGFAGLGVDVSLWYAQKRASQTAADAAALSGAWEILRTNGQELQAAVAEGAGLHGFADANGDVITVHWPPVNGAYIGDASRVEVIVRRAAPLAFTPQFIADDFGIEARAVAGVVNAAQGCVVALNETAPSAFRTHGTGDVTLDCAVYSNSSDADDAVNQVGSSCVNAGAVYSVGGASGDCINPAPVTGVNHFPDPLADLPEPTYAGCDHNGKTKVNGNDDVTLQPGTYCGNIEISATAHFAPGLYYLRDSAMSLNAGSVVTGDDVTFFFNDSGNTNDNLTVNGQANVTLRAPSDPNDNYHGILIYQSRDVDHNMTHTFNGGSNTTLEGTIYAAGAEVQFNGGSDVTIWDVLVLADTVDIGGNTEIAGYEYADGSQVKIGSAAALYE